MVKKVAFGVGLLCLVLLPGVARLLGQGEVPDGRMGPPPPPVVLTVADGVVYLACGPTLIAYEAKTLKKLAEVSLPRPKGRPEQGKAGPDDRAPEPPEAQGLGGPGGPMGPPMSPPQASLAVSDKYVFVLLGLTIYQFDAKSLKELNHVDLKIEKPPFGPGAPERQGEQ